MTEGIVQAGVAEQPRLDAEAAERSPVPVKSPVVDVARHVVTTVGTGLVPADPGDRLIGAVPTRLFPGQRPAGARLTAPQPAFRRPPARVFVAAGRQEASEANVGYRVDVDPEGRQLDRALRFFVV